MLKAPTLKDFIETTLGITYFPGNIFKLNEGANNPVCNIMGETKLSLNKFSELVTTYKT